MLLEEYDLAKDQSQGRNYAIKIQSKIRDDHKNSYREGWERESHQGRSSHHTTTHHSRGPAP